MKPAPAIFGVVTTRPAVERVAGQPKDLVAGVKSDIARLEAVLPEDHVVLLILRFELAKLLLRAGADREADATLARVVAETRQTVGLAHPKIITLLEVYVPRYGPEWGTFLDSGPVYARINAERMFAFYFPDAAM